MFTNSGPPPSRSTPRQHVRAEGTTALGVAVHLGHDHGADVDGPLERGRLAHRGLTDAAVHHENDIVRFLPSCNGTHDGEGWLSVCVA